MLPKSAPIFRTFPLWACLLVATIAGLSAQEVTTRLSSSQTRVGQPVQMIVTVEGSTRAKMPNSIPVNGLRINLADRRSSQSVQFGAGGLKTTSTTTYIYLVVPQFESEFTIPPFEIEIDGRQFRTQPLRLTVSGTAQVPTSPTLPRAPGAQPMPQPGEPDSEAVQYFGELVLSKKKAYVGEVIPAELRFYFSQRIGGQISERPAFGGEGFTVQRFSDSSRLEQVVDGEPYMVFTFKTAVTPAKSGKIEIPPAKLEARLQLPGSVPPGMADIFGNFGGMLPPGMFTETQDVAVETKPVTIDVLPLPKEGQPEDFSGAIGRFTMEGSVSPKKAEPGEPVTLSAKVSGQGNLEAMGPPSLVDDEGWRSYPPTDKLSETDAIGFSGDKTFEFPIVARTPQTQTPGLRFSYFDPVAGRYETLTVDPLAVEAQATDNRTASAAATAVPTAPEANATATPAVSITASGAKSWRPLLLRREFLVANASLVVAWLAVFGILAIRRHAASEAGTAAARVRQARAVLQRASHATPEAFDSLAFDYLCLRLACDPLAVPDRLKSLSLPQETTSALAGIVERHAESRYAAGSRSLPTSDQQSAAIEALKTLEKKHV